MVSIVCGGNQEYKDKSACLQQTVCGLSCASSLEEVSFWDDSHTDQFDAVCSVWCEHWQADPPIPSASAAMLAALIRLFSKHNLWTWCWARALNFFGLPFLSGTCPVKPLYGLGHHAAAQFQGLDKLLISYAIFM